MAFEDVQFPAMLPENPLKRGIKVTLGHLYAALHPAYTRQVAAGQMPARIGTKERLIIASLVDRHRRAGTLGELAPLHAWLWQGEQAVAFHEQAKARFEHWWLGHHAAIVEPIGQLLEAPGSPYVRLCEIGCGSGLVLEDLAKRLPSLEALVGLDLSPQQTERNRQRSVDPRIRFEAGDATVWVPAFGQNGTVYLTVAGVFEYFPRAALQTLFGTIANQKPPAVIALIEPIPADYQLDTERESRPYGSEYSLGHNYPLLLREAGFAIRYQEHQRFEGCTHLLVVAERR